VKAVGGEGTRLRVFLSRNELSVAREVQAGTGLERHHRGRWVLLAVRPDGSSQALTEALDPVVDGEAEHVQALGTHGFRLEGVEMTVDVG